LEISWRRRRARRWTFLVLVKEEEGKGKEEQETGVLTDSLEVKTKMELTDGLKLLTADQEQARWLPDPQPERPGRVSSHS
jgi:hypothetical protein